MKIVDPHIHLFDLKKGRYAWLKADNPPFWPDKSIIQRSFGEQDLKLEHCHELAGFIHIEAGFNNTLPWEELSFLQHHVSAPFKAIAGIDLCSANHECVGVLKRLQKYACFVGVRHILDSQAQDILNHKNCTKNLALLAQQEVIFELQMSFEDTLSVDAFLDVLVQFPEFRIAINHAGWPPTESRCGSDKEARWLYNLTRIAEFPNVVIKASGWEMIDRKYNAQWQYNVLMNLLDIFGKKRVLMASNFPLTLFSKSYADYWENTLKISEYDQALCYDNARQFYRL